MENQGNKKFITLVIIVVLIVGIAWYFMSGSNPSAGSGTPTPLPVATSTADANPIYKDGTYTAEGDYQTHVGQKFVTVSLTLQGDIVTDATVTSEPNVDPTSAHYQGLFISGYKQYVIGQNIDSLNLLNISGSSLTPNGFNDAVAKIKTQAAM